MSNFVKNPSAAKRFPGCDYAFYNGICMYGASQSEENIFIAFNLKLVENFFYNLLEETNKRLETIMTLIFFYAGTIVAQGPVEEILKKMPEIETREKKENSVKETGKERPDVEGNDDIAQVEQLREAEEDRQVGNVSFNVDTKYFMHGAPASILFLVLLAIGAAQGKP
jgi:hypothetical protein